MEKTKEGVDLTDAVMLRLLHTLAEVNTWAIKEVRDLATADRPAAIRRAGELITALTPFTGGGKCRPGFIWDPVSGMCIPVRIDGEELKSADAEEK